MTLYDTYCDIILKYNLVRYDYGTTAVYRFPFPPKYFQNGWLIRYVPLFNSIEMCSSLKLDEDNSIVYYDNVDYDPFLFDKLIKRCYKISKKLKQLELNDKLERIKDDFK